jgi:hypothetical protein
MADTSRGVIKYTSRDYNSIMTEFWEIVPKLTDLWKPEADADPGVVLGKILASAADMLGVSVDLLANELFAPSVTQRKNAEKLFGLIGYTLGWYTAARTEVTFQNNTENSIIVDFGFSGSDFSTLNAYTDITDQPRVITYNVLPMTNSYGFQNSRSRRDSLNSDIDIFATSDRVSLSPGGSVTRVAIEGELRNITVSVKTVKENNYIITLPSQHIDTTAIWLKAKSNLSEGFLDTRWLRVDTTADFVDGEPRFCVSYDNYGNAQIQVSTVLNSLENYEDNYFVIYWFDCSGVIGSVSQDVLQDFKTAIPATGNVNNFAAEDIKIINLANTIELPHTYTVTGKSPETAKEAYINSRNYINTWDSLVTLPDYNRFIKREAGVDSGLVIDCQKALEINVAIYKSTSLTEAQKNKQYIGPTDFPIAKTNTLNWRNILIDMGISENDLKGNNLPFPCNFQTYSAMCFCIHNDFDDATDYTPSEFIDVAPEKYTNGKLNYSAVDMPAMNYTRYRPPISFLDGIMADYRGLGALSVDLQFGYARISPWYVVGEIYPKTPVSRETGNVLIAKAKEALALYFSAGNRDFGQKPTTMEVVNVIENSSDNIRYFDAGSLKNPVINWGERKTFANNQTMMVSYDIDYFNPISFAKYQDVGDAADNIRIAPEWLID